jgi:oligoribonuclease NrnB/cAMP/cGMP phosphodiesterase (DHH superfamily)
MEHSGAALAWFRFHGRRRAGDDTLLPELFAYIQDRDLWRWKLPGTREVSAALGASGALTNFRKLVPIFRDWNNISLGQTLRERLISEGGAILRAERLQVERIVATAEEVVIPYFDNIETATTARGATGMARMRSVRVLAACSSVLQSEVGEELAIESARRGREAVGVAYYKDGPSGKWRVSLRSRDIEVPNMHPRDDRSPGQIPAPDVSAIAKSFNGGGHHQAAGFECERLPWDNDDLDVIAIRNMVEKQGERYDDPTSQACDEIIDYIDGLKR